MSEFNLIYIAPDENQKKTHNEMVLAKLFNTNIENIQKRYKNGCIVLQSNLSREKAEQTKSLLAQHSIQCEIQANSLSLTLEENFTPAPSSISQESCPKCGSTKKNSHQCDSCGIFFHKLATAASPKAQTDAQVANRQPLTETIREGILAITLEWIKKHLLLSAAAGIFVFIFGSGFLVSSIFFENDYHISYDIVSSTRLCPNFAPIFEGRGSLKTFEKNLFAKFQIEYERHMRKIVKTYGSHFCTIEYHLTLGNIGTETIDRADLKLSEAIRDIFPDRTPMHHIFYSKRQMPGERSQKEVKIIEKNDLDFEIQDLTPGSIVVFRFRAWTKNADPIPDWANFLYAIESKNALVDMGNPEVTAFTRFLTNIF